MSSDLHVHSLWPATRPGDTDIGYAVDAARRRTALIVCHWVSVLRPWRSSCRIRSDWSLRASPC